jgi:hypothetical protein
MIMAHVWLLLPEPCAAQTETKNNACNLPKT